MRIIINFLLFFVFILPVCSESVIIETPNGSFDIDSITKKDDLIYFNLVKTLDKLKIKNKYSSITERLTIDIKGKQLVLFNEASHYIKNDKEIIELPGAPFIIQKALFLDLESFCVFLEEIYDKKSRWDSESLKIIFPEKRKNGSNNGAGFSGKVQTVVIDAGHGGRDGGAVGKSKKTIEKIYTLDIALQLVKIIEDKGMKAVLTREKDEFIALEERARIANDIECDLFISIHMNAHPKTRQGGTEVYIYDVNATDTEALAVAERENEGNGENHLDEILRNLQKQSFDEYSIAAAGYILESLTNGLKLKARQNKKIMRAPFRVLKHTKMPAVLVEVLYLTNANEEKLIQNRDFRKKAALKIYEGIKAYKSYLEKK